MPCMKCSNGKYKYGEHGKCVFDTLAACKRAAAAIHVQDKAEPDYTAISYLEICCKSCEKDQHYSLNEA